MRKFCVKCMVSLFQAERPTTVCIGVSLSKSLVFHSEQSFGWSSISHLGKRFVYCVRVLALCAQPRWPHCKKWSKWTAYFVHLHKRAYGWEECVWYQSFNYWTIRALLLVFSNYLYFRTICIFKLLLKWTRIYFSSTADINFPSVILI